MVLVLRKLFPLVLLLSIFGSNVFADSKVLVIPKGVRASFWNHFGEGALQAGKDLGLTVVIRGPRSEADTNAQINIIDYGLRLQFDAIVLAPSHVNVTSPILEQAVAKDVRIVLADSNMTSNYHSSLVASDNEKAGRMAANNIASLLDNSGRVILARHIKGHGSTDDRELGFLNTLASNYPQITVVADPYVGTSRGEAYHTISRLLNELQVDAIFCDGEEATVGILKALSEISGPEKPIFIGFDFNETIRDALHTGEMDATIVQNPYQIGYQSVVVIDQLLQKKDVARKVYTDLLWVTQDNFNSQEVQKVIKQYLPSKKPGE